MGGLPAMAAGPACAFPRERVSLGFLNRGGRKFFSPFHFGLGEGRENWDLDKIPGLFGGSSGGGTRVTFLLWWPRRPVTSQKGQNALRRESDWEGGPAVTISRGRGGVKGKVVPVPLVGGMVLLPGGWGKGGGQGFRRYGPFLFPVQPGDCPWVDSGGYRSKMFGFCSGFPGNSWISL